MWPKFVNSSISMREVIMKIIRIQGFFYKGSFVGWYWFKCSNFGLAVEMALWQND